MFVMIRLYVYDFNNAIMAITRAINEIFVLNKSIESE